MCKISAPTVQAATPAPSKSSDQVQRETEDARFFGSDNTASFSDTRLTSGVGITAQPRKNRVTL